MPVPVRNVLARSQATVQIGRLVLSPTGRSAYRAFGVDFPVAGSDGIEG